MTEHPQSPAGETFTTIILGKNVTVNTRPISDLFNTMECSSGIDLAKILHRVKEHLVLTYSSQSDVPFEQIKEDFTELTTIANIFEKFVLVEKKD